MSVADIFLNDSVNPFCRICLLIVVFNPFTFNVITDKEIRKDLFLLLCYLFSTCHFFVS